MKKFRITIRSFSTQAIIGYAYGETAAECQKDVKNLGVESYSILLKDKDMTENYYPISKDKFKFAAGAS